MSDDSHVVLPICSQFSPFFARSVISVPVRTARMRIPSPLTSGIIHASCAFTLPSSAVGITFCDCDPNAITLVPLSPHHALLFQPTEKPLSPAMVTPNTRQLLPSPNSQLSCTVNSTSMFVLPRSAAERSSVASAGFCGERLALPPTSMDLTNVASPFCTVFSAPRETAEALRFAEAKFSRR